jgi:hypothetical protein
MSTWACKQKVNAGHQSLAAALLLDYAISFIQTSVKTSSCSDVVLMLCRFQLQEACCDMPRGGQETAATQLTISCRRLPCHT